MTHYILCGENAIENLQEQNWKLLELDILHLNNGEIVSFDTSEFRNGLHELLNSLRGWNNFVELSPENLKTIEQNTKIEIFKPEYVKEPIYWSTEDFETQAKQNFEELKADEHEEFKHLKSWEQLYDKSKFPNELERMISRHDANEGINWFTIEEYLGNCEIK